MPCGQIIARNPSTWLVRVYLGRDPVTGKRRYRNQTVHGGREAAERELAALLAATPRRPEPASALDEYLDWWLYAAIEGRLRPKTARDYRMLLARYVRPELGKVRLDRLQPLALQGFLVELTERGLSARTVRYTHAVLRSALDQARRWKLLRENPAVDLPLPRLERDEPRVLTAVEAQCFTTLCLADPGCLVFLVALTTGLRPSEYLALRVEDFDPCRSILTIRRTLERAGLPTIRLYDLRHTFATLALREGVPAQLVSEQLGHADVAFTLETYGYVLEETRGEAANQLGHLLFRARRKPAASVEASIDLNERAVGQ